MKKTGTKKWVIVLLHIAAWILLFSLPYLLRPSYDPNDHRRPDAIDPVANFIAARINDLMLILFFYFNAGVLFPKLVYRKKYVWYFAALAGWFVVFWFLSTSLWQFVSPPGYVTMRKHLPFTLFVFLFILACSIAYKTITDKVKADNLVREKQNENLKTELSLLRSQVSPHFMFNVLNNMVALARKQSELLEPSLIKLSSLMRYMLYETGEEKVTLEKETEYLQSYIDLQLQRFGKKLMVNTAVLPADKQYDIEPMLLIPFVENAFKHGTGMIEQPQIDIKLEAKHNLLLFTVTNKYDPSSTEIKDDASGIGLANVRRRLELLYHHQHVLNISRENGIFNVSLQIQLHS
ncbi:MAG: histidine kinase [Bacteroidetes bacterium]|nr:histidine kinase [Bacteroidota bacterium]